MIIPRLSVDYELVLEKVIRKYNLKLPAKIIRISYDDRDDILEIDFSIGEVEYSDPIGEGIIVEYDANGNIIGIVIEKATRFQ